MMEIPLTRNATAIVDDEDYDRLMEHSYLHRIPVDGFYHYKTLPQMFGDWIIAGGMKIDRILSDDEVAEILKEYDLKPQPRKEPLDISSYGFNDSPGKV